MRTLTYTCFAAALLLNFGCSKKEDPQPQPVRPVKIITVGESQSNTIRKYPGKVSALDRVTLAFQVDGPLIELPVIKGQPIKQGDLLARIDPRDYQNRLDAATAGRDQAATQLERIKKASVSGAVSQSDLTNAQAEFDKSDAILRAAQKAMEDTRMMAPFDAVIGDIFVDNFQNVQAKQNVLSIQKIEEVLIEVNVPEERILQAPQNAGKLRFVALFDSLPGREFDVELHEFTTEADPLTQTFKVTFSMPKPADVNILSGMTATITGRPKDGKIAESAPLLVPIASLPIDKDGRYFVWKMEPAGEGIFSAVRHSVEIGSLEQDSAIITKGLVAGDKIAGSGVHSLREGQQVCEFVAKSTEAAQ